MWNSFFDALGTLTAWAMALMLGIVVFVWARAFLEIIWSVFQMLTL